MFKPFGILALAVFAVGIPVLALSQWNDGEAEAGETKWRQWEGDFGAMLLLTRDVDEFYEEWSNTPLEHGPTIRTVSTAVRGDIVSAVIVFAGCAADEAGNCLSQVDFKVLFPDGTLYGELLGVELWSNNPAAPAHTLQIGEATLGIRVEEDDPFGSYRIEAVVRDLVGEVELQLLQMFEVVELRQKGAG